MSRRPFYNKDLAYIHDAGFSDYARQLAPQIVRFIGHPRRRPLVVEFGCGGGVIARHLVDAGFDVVGIDASPAMIRLARQRTREFVNW